MRNNGGRLSLTNVGSPKESELGGMVRGMLASWCDRYESSPPHEWYDTTPDFFLTLGRLATLVDAVMERLGQD
jgi:hypothetical protein